MDKFVGAWNLKSFSMTTRSGFVKFYPLGRNPRGILIYDKNGVMSVQITKEKRKTFSSKFALFGLGKKSEINDTIRNYVAYCGTYHADDHSVKHKILNHIIPNEIGKDYERFYDFNENYLTLRTSPIKVGVFSLIGSLVWEKMSYEKV